MKRKLFFTISRQVTRRCTVNHISRRFACRLQTREQLISRRQVRSQSHLTQRFFCTKNPDEPNDSQKPFASTSEDEEKRENPEFKKEENEANAENAETETPKEHKEDEAEKPANKWMSRLSVLGGGAYLLSKGGKLLGLLKFTKIGPLISMGVSTLAYSWVFGWPYAVGMISLLFIHESGHAFAMRRLGIEVGPMVFIPFMGAAVVMKDMPKNAMQEAIVAYAGPLIGTLGTLPFLAYGLTTGSQLAFALANFGLIINCFNLVPFGSLDGGRIAPCISKWLYPLGLSAMAYVCIYHNVSPLLYLIFFAGLYETYQRFMGKRELPPGFMNITGAQRLAITIAYFGLIAFIMYMLKFNERYMKSVEELQRAEKVIFFGGTDEENNLRTFFNNKGRTVDDLRELETRYANALFEGSGFQMDRGFYRFDKENPFEDKIRFAFYEGGLGQIKIEGRDMLQEEKDLWVQIYSELSQHEVNKVQETIYNPQLGSFYSFEHKDGTGCLLENEKQDVLYSFPNWDEYINDMR